MKINKDKKIITNNKTNIDIYLKEISIILMMTLMCYLNILFDTFADNVPNQIIDNENNIYLTEMDYSIMTNLYLIAEKYGTIYKVQTPKNVSIIRDKEDFIYNLRLSPDNKIISFLQTDVYGAKEKKLILLDMKTKNEKELIKDNILEFKWSPDSKKIVYITGQYGHPDGLTLTGIWIYLIEKNSKFRFAAKALTVEWYQNEFIYLIDTNISHTDNKIIRKTKKYYPDKRKMDQENHEGLKYSPDDRYYLRISDDNVIKNMLNPWDFNKRIVLDICDCNTEICISRDKLKNIYVNPEDIEWENLILSYNDMIIIPRKQNDSEINTVYNIKSNMQIKEIFGKIIGTDYIKKKIAVLNKGEFEIIELP